MTTSANFPTTRPSLLLDFADTRLLDPRITFARASTATFYDQTTTALAEQNLLLQSQAFNNGYWGSVATTVSDNTTVAPDGTTTASTITLGVSGANALFNATGISVTALSTYTFSFYALRGTATDMSYAIYNLTGASFITAVSYYSQTNSSTWSRIVVTFTVPAGCTSARVYTSSNSTSTGTFYLWGAQLEQRSTATAYTPTTTAAITNYIPVMQTAASGVARFDCNPTTGESLGLLIEESRTNLLTYSSDFTNAAWSKTSVTVTAAANTAPDGSQTALMLVEDSTNNTHFISGNAASGGAATYTMSAYVKAGYRTWAYLTDNATVTATAYFNLTTGTVGTVSGTGSPNATITPVGNGWYRIAMTLTTTGAPVLRVGAASGDGGKQYTGIGWNSLQVWGAQLEAGSFATSYIPTVASQVTRAADSASMTGTNFSSWYNVGQGSFYVDENIQWNATDTTTRLIGTLTTTSGVGYVFYKNSLDTNIRSYDGTNILNTPLVFGANKFISAYGGATKYLCANAGTVVSGAYNSSWATASAFGFGNSNCATIKRIAYYPKALTSTQLQAITS